MSELLGAQRVGLVGYRDQVETKLAATDDPQRIRNALAKLRADRGGAPDEGVDLALRTAFNSADMGLKAGPAVVVVVGDAGPSPVRVPGLLAGLRTFRAAHAQRRLHALVLPPSGAVSDFWKDLTREGGGQVLSFDEQSVVMSLCLALLEATDRATLARVLQVIGDP